MLSTSLLAAARVTAIDTVIVWVYPIGIMVMGIAAGLTCKQYFQQGI